MLSVPNCVRYFWAPIANRRHHGSCKGFDKWDYIIDRWGLFNPPGVGPFDKDPDDDIPFRGFWEDPEK
jgi:hypothetical protein